MTISPHVVALNERVQVGGMPLMVGEFCSALERVLGRLAPLRGRLTYFEIMSCLALSVFAEYQVDYAVVEVGIGGMRDATNVLAGTDKVGVIGPIGLDHTERLGSTVTAIAAEKAGIMVAGGVGVVARQSAEVMSVVEERASTIGADLVVVDSAPAGSVGVGGFQAQNWAMARATVEYLAGRDGFGVPDRDVGDPAQLGPPARHEWYHLGSHRVLLDGAHNDQEMTSLVQVLTDLGIGPLPVLATLSQAPESKIAQTLAALKPAVSSLIVPEFQVGHDGLGKQSAPASQVAAIATDLGIKASVVLDLDAALAALLAYPNRDLLITGSLYLAALVRPRLIQVPAKTCPRPAYDRGPYNLSDYCEIGNLLETRS